MSEIRVAVVQAASSLDPAANRAALERLTPTDTDLVVFPEAFARDFGTPGSDVRAFAEAVDGTFATEVAAVAAARRTTVLAGMFEDAGPDAPPFNTLVMRGSTRADYRKVHLYDSFGFRESEVISPGPVGAVVTEVGGLRVGLMTCYDLRFPEQARSLVDAGAEVLVLPAAWVAGERKVEHWRTLLRARAIENTTYVVAAGQPGPRYTGHSMVVAPDGDVLAEAGVDEEVLRVTLSGDEVARTRATNPSLLNRRL